MDTIYGPCRSAVALCAFAGSYDSTTLAFAAGEALEVWPDGSGWWWAQNSCGDEGYVPRTLVALDDGHITVATPVLEIPAEVVPSAPPFEPDEPPPPPPPQCSSPRGGALTPTKALSSMRRGMRTLLSGAKKVSPTAPPSPEAEESALKGEVRELRARNVSLQIDNLRLQSELEQLSPPMSPPATPSSRCSECGSRETATTLVPCGHVLCGECGRLACRVLGGRSTMGSTEEVLTELRHCPVCAGRVTSLVHLF